MILVSGFGLLRSEAGWDSELGVSFGYASIALMASAFLRPSARGAGLPSVTAGIAGWMVLTVMFAFALAVEGSPDDGVQSFAEVAGGVIGLPLMLAAAVWCGWRTLMLLARYAAKRFSDVQLSQGAYWALMHRLFRATVRAATGGTC